MTQTRTNWTDLAADEGPGPKNDPSEANDLATEQYLRAEGKYAKPLVLRSNAWRDPVPPPAVGDYILAKGGQAFRVESVKIPRTKRGDWIFKVRRVSSTNAGAPWDQAPEGVRVFEWEWRTECRL